MPGEDARGEGNGGGGGVGRGVSGGVDSSVAVAMLKEEGHNVIGVGLLLFDGNETAARPGSCCGVRDLEDARR